MAFIMDFPIKNPRYHSVFTLPRNQTTCFHVSKDLMLPNIFNHSSRPSSCRRVDGPTLRAPYFPVDFPYIFPWDIQGEIRLRFRYLDPNKYNKYT